jgi:hypothetical protein
MRRDYLRANADDARTMDKVLGALLKRIKGAVAQIQRVHKMTEQYESGGDLVPCLTQLCFVVCRHRECIQPCNKPVEKGSQSTDVVSKNCSRLPRPAAAPCEVD